MRLIGIRFRVARVSAPLTLAVGAGLLAGCASFGTFDENEPGLEESLFGGVIGIVATEQEPNIDYSARAPLVAPPNANALPTPRQQTAATSDPNWPTGSRARIAQVLEAEDRTLVFTPGVDGVDIQATQALAQRTRTSTTTRRQEEIADGERLTPDEIRREEDIQLARQEARVAQENVATGSRRFLTDPPATTRAPSSEAPFGSEAIEEEESGGWWPF
ncbi:MAG: hypothetical protein AAF590_00585 [Pseudomonadota bacterium]